MNKLFTKTARRHLTHWFACLTLLAFPAIAQAFVIDSLEYKVTDEAKNEVALTAYAIGLSGDVTIPAKVEYEGVKYKVTSIGEYAFQYCIGLKTIDIPNSISSIGEYAFDYCEGLETINISPSSPIKRIENNTFSFCSSLTSITIPDSVTYIGSYAISSCAKLTEIIVPNSVTIINQFAFAYCGDLTSITLPNTIKTLELCLLEGCKSLSTFKIPDSVESIAAGVFDYCEGLTRIEIPSSVKSIGERAFFQCTNLSYVYIPKSVSTIQEGAFEGCPKLEDPEHPENAIYCEVEEEPEGWDLFHDYDGGRLNLNVVWASSGATEQAFVIDNLKYKITDEEKREVSVSANSTELSGNVTIPAEVEYEGVKYKVTAIAKGGFHECAELTSIDIPNTVTAIGRKAFYECRSLTTANIPDSITTIEGETFFFCENLKSITIPSNVTSIGEFAFAYCRKLAQLEIPNSVTSIDGSAFGECVSLHLLEIPESVKHIGPTAFHDCEYLTIIIEDSTSLVLDEGALSDVKIVLYKNKEEYLIDEPFIYGDKEKEHLIGYFGTDSVITIPNTVKYIEENVFRRSKATSITIPNSVTYIGKNAFNFCSMLTSITIPNSVTSIDTEAFSYCKNLINVQIPKSVTQIGANTFYGCEKLVDEEQPKQAIYCDMKEKPEGWDVTWNYFKYDGTLCHTFWNERASLSTNASPVITKIYASEGTIIIEGFTGDISVFNPAGQLILRRTIAEPYTEIPVVAGLYIVKAGETSERVIVR
ncbi:MAG: leucine-rich repeat domain-containing protein [Paludibacteraceae bacterium]|nr:leucine-rich repeat domain-containing protein [Paludibacteraceae bacterium]